MCLLSTAFYSCKDDDDDTSNYFTVGDATYDLNYGLIENNGQADSDGSYNTDLSFYSQEFTDEDGDGQYDNISDVDMLYFKLYSTTGTALDEGTYTYDAESTEAGTYDTGEYIINYSFDYSTYTSTYDNLGLITSGDITISKDGDTYTIEIDCTSYSGSSITGYYKGSLDYEDYDSSTSSSSSISTLTKAKKLRFKKVE